MQKELETQFNDLMAIGNKRHGTTYQACKGGAITQSEVQLLHRAVKFGIYTPQNVLHAAKYAGKKKITITLQ